MTTSPDHSDPEVFHSLVSDEIQRQGNIRQWAYVATCQLHLDSAVAGTLRQFPDATALLVEFDRNGGDLRPVGVEGPEGRLAIADEAWATKELPGTIGRTIWDDLASLDAEQVARLKLQQESPHVFRVDLSRKYYRRVDSSPLDKVVYEGA